MRWLVSLLAVLALPACANHGAGTLSSNGPINHLPALAGNYFAIDSAKASHRYHIFIRHPEGYDDQPGKRWPVVYLLDGDSTFPLLAPQHLFLHYDEGLPEAIIVGIAYGSFAPPQNRRGYDFSAPAPGAGEDQGGASAFLHFIEHELIPSVERRVRADPARRVLVGQSRGGYMVLWSAYASPDLFWGRIASNPSMTPGRDMLFSDPIAAPASDNLSLFVASGSRERNAERRAGALEWGAYWRSRSDAPWATRLYNVEEGTHAANLPDAYRAGMLWLFRDEIEK